MTPFTPQKEDNMIAWLAARLRFPRLREKCCSTSFRKTKLIFGPNQISAMIDQKHNHSQQLTLWTKGIGSHSGQAHRHPD